MAKATSKTGKTSTTKSSKSYDDDDEVEAVKAVEDESSADEVEEVTPDDDEELKKGEPVPPTGSPTKSAKPTDITLKGSGTMSIMFDGEVHSLERGKKIKVPAGLAAALVGETEEEKTK